MATRYFHSFPTSMSSNHRQPYLIFSLLSLFLLLSFVFFLSSSFSLLSFPLFNHSLHFPPFSPISTFCVLCTLFHSPSFPLSSSFFLSLSFFFSTIFLFLLLFLYLFLSPLNRHPDRGKKRGNQNSLTPNIIAVIKIFLNYCILSLSHSFIFFLSSISHSLLLFPFLSHFFIFFPHPFWEQLESRQSLY